MIFVGPGYDPWNRFTNGFGKIIKMTKISANFQIRWSKIKTDWQRIKFSFSGSFSHFLPIGKSHKTAHAGLRCNSKRKYSSKPVEKDQRNRVKRTKQGEIKAKRSTLYVEKNFFHEKTLCVSSKNRSWRKRWRNTKKLVSTKHLSAKNVYTLSWKQGETRKHETGNRKNGIVCSRLKVSTP